MKLIQEHIAFLASVKICKVDKTDCNFGNMGTVVSFCAKMSATNSPCHSHSAFFLLPLIVTPLVVFFFYSFSPDSVERQMRLVGDMAFLLHNYELAYSMHHSLKKELQGKELSLLYAQALVRREREKGTATGSRERERNSTLCLASAGNGISFGSDDEPVPERVTGLSS